MSTPIRASDMPNKPANKRSYNYNLGLSRPTDHGADEANVDFSVIGSTIARYKWLILVTCLVVTGAVTAYTLTLPKIYEARSIVSVGASPAAKSAGVWPSGDGVELSKEVGLLENSGELNQRVVETLSAIADTASDVRFTVFESDDGETVTPFEVVERLQEKTDFSGLDDQSMIRITAESESPEEATFIVNAYAEEYRRFSQEMARAGVVAARQFLEDQVAKRQRDIREIEGEWEDFALTNEVVTEGEDGDRVASKYVDLQAQRDALQFELEQEQRMKSILESQLEKLQPSLRTSVLAEQQVQSLRTQIQTLEDELARLQMQADQYYVNNPNLRGNEERVPELAELKRLIDGYSQRKAELTEQLVDITEDRGRVALGGDGTGTNALGQISTLEERIEERDLAIRQLESQIRGLDRQIAEYEGRLENIPGQIIRREQIQRRLTQAEEFYQDIVKELQQTIIAEESELGYVSVVRAGIVPDLPVSPDLNQNVLLGLLLGLGFGIGLAFIAQSMNPRVYEPKDIQSHGYNLLGVVPTMDAEIKSMFDGKEKIDVDGRELSTTLLPLLNPWSTVTENYRLMRTNLQYAVGDGGNGEMDSPPQVLLVTSPEPSDGKTTTAANLAITFALSGHDVLLIDADLRRPNVHKLMGLDGSRGLADVLTGKASLDDVRQSFIEGLSVIPAGETSTPPAEILDSQRMQDLISRGREEADVVIVDTPPVLSATDALVLAVQSDATLVVAHAGKTDRRTLVQVEDTFGAVGVPVSAVIFNKFDVESDYNYGYGYDYDYTPKIPA